MTEPDVHTVQYMYCVQYMLAMLYAGSMSELFGVEYIHISSVMIC